MLFPVPDTVIVAFDTPVVADVEESEPIATSFTALTVDLFPIAIELSLLAFEP